MKTTASLALITGCALVPAASALAQTPATMSIAQAVRLAWEAEPDHVYQLQASPDLAPGAWLDVGEPFLGDKVATHTALVTPPASFFRVLVLPQPLITDPPGNLTGNPASPGSEDYPDGDPTRGFMDIVACTVLDEGANYAFTVQVAAPFPDAAAMSNKRIDFIFFVDADQDTGTGQSADGNDYNIHLVLDANGWGAWWGKVAQWSENDGIAIDYNLFEFRAAGDRATLVFPKSFLPTSSFDLWMVCHNGVSQEATPPWLPFTHQPPTARAAFGF